MTNTNVAVAAPALTGVRPALEKTQPLQFANIEALLASRPVTAGNCQARSYGEAVDAGRTIMQALAASYGCYEGEPLPVQDDRSESSALKGRDILMERVIGGMAGNYGYVLAYAQAAEARLRAHMTTEERDRDGVAGFESRSMTLLEQLMERDAQAAWLCDTLQGATEEFLAITGTVFKLYVPTDRAANARRTTEQKAVVADRLAAFLASRKAG